jgi:uncharacterized protein
MPTDLVWEALDWPGLEHVIVSPDAAGFRAESQLVVGPPSGPASISYQLSCDAGWRVTGLTISLASAAGRRSLDLSADTDGHWQVNGKRKPELDGCIDVDFALTPLTNTLPIRRLTWSAGQSRDLDMAYVTAELTVRPARQRYTQLGQDAEKGIAWYRYQSGSFSADLTVDGDGYVTDYPELWRRVGPTA